MIFEETGFEIYTVVSVHSSDNGIAFVVIELSGFEAQGFQKVELLEVWERSPGQGDLFTALKVQNADGYLFNGQKTAEGLRNPLFDKAKAYGLQSVKYAKPFTYSEGQAIFESMQAENKWAASEAPGWPKLAVQLERSGTQQAAAAWAFLQSAIYADKKLGGGNEFASSFSTVEPRPTNHFY